MQKLIMLALCAAAGPLAAADYLVIKSGDTLRPILLPPGAAAITDAPRLTSASAPSQSQMEAVVALAGAKKAKLAELTAAMAAAINAGVTVSGQTYGITDTDQAQWIAALTALQNAQTVLAFDPGVQDATAILGPLLNKAGQPVGTVTVSQFRGIMASLTQSIGTLRAGTLAKIAALNSATTIAQVEAITPTD